MLQVTALALCALLLGGPSLSHLPDQGKLIDKSRIPARADDVKKFVPPGWKIEQQVAGDLNGDSVPEYALKLVEDKPAKNSEEVATERQRALVILVQETGRQLVRVGVADKLLQCTSCGGALYSLDDSPAEVTIEKGVIVVQQGHGSNNITNTTYRFRYDPITQRIVLIGFDYTNADRGMAQDISESTNYLTGVRTVSRNTGERILNRSTRIPRSKIFIDQIDSEKFDADATKRLGLD